MKKEANIFVDEEGNCRSGGGMESMRESIRDFNFFVVQKF